MNNAIPTPNRCVVSGFAFAALMCALPGFSVADSKLPAMIFDHKLPNAGQAVLIDVGEAGDIHPRNKKDVGDRLTRMIATERKSRSADWFISR
jgi:hypothetical protein